MKKILLSLCLSVMLLNACTTRVVSSNKPYSDDKISLGKTYNFFTKDGKKESITVTKIDEEKIYGSDSEEKPVSIEKSNISEVKKGNALATIGLAAAAIGLAVVGSAYYNNKPVGQ